MQFWQVLDFLPMLQVFLHPLGPPSQYLQLAQGPLDEQHINYDIYPGLSLVELLHCCPLIGRELQSVEIIS